MHAHRNTRTSPFTLIELLVVVAIIAILASLLLPALGAARNKARSTACLNDLKQLHLGMQFYVDATDDFLVRGNQSGGLWGQAGVAGNGWLSQIYDDVNSLDVITCPSDNYKHSTYPTLSYYYSQNLAAGEKNNTWMTRPWKLGHLTNPGNTVMLWECTSAYFNPNDPAESYSRAYCGWHERGGLPASGVLYGLAGTSNYWKLASVIAGARHSERSNFLASDGHAIKLRGQEVSGGQTATSTTHGGGGYTNARGAAAVGDGVVLTMSPR